MTDWAKRTAFCTLCVIVMSISALAANEPTETGPVPIQLLSAKKVFISNLGIEGNALAAFNKVGYTPYARFCAEMKTWGHYELVTAPGDADLVFEIRFLAPSYGENSYAPQFKVTVLDLKTHVVLWTFLQPVQGAIRETTWNKNFSAALSSLMDNIKKIVVPAAVP